MAVQILFVNLMEYENLLGVRVLGGGYIPGQFSEATPC